MLRVEGLKVRGLAPISFSVHEGDVLAVRGASGAGKTVLLRGIADLDPCDGLVFVGGGERHEDTGPEWRKKVRYVAAEAAWWSERVQDHFSDPERLVRDLRNLALPDDILERRVTRLSTGERQRLGLLRSLEGSPKVLLLDEPTAALDDGTRALAEELIRYRALAGASVVMVTHDDGQARRLASRVLRLADGQGRLVEAAAAGARV